METPEFFHGGYYEAEFSPDKRLLEKNGDNFIVEELLDLPNDDGGGLVAVTDGGALEATADSSTVTALETSCNSSFSGEMTCHHLLDGQFSSDFSVPYDDLAELEWLSNIVEEPFSSEDMEKMQLISGIKARNDEASEAQIVQPDNARANAVPMFRPDVSIPAKARSKRSRVAPGNWASRILAVSVPVTNTTSTTTTTVTTSTAIMPTPTISSSSESDIAPNHARKRMKTTMKKKECSPNGGAAAATTSNNSEGRRCLHCDTDKTPQWRTGPMGPKTLCNACGVRYKSGRLVPEYRPAASPTFVLTKHSNSHRKVLEIRRQKELLRAQQQHQQQFLHQNMMFDVSNANDYLIHQHVGPDYRQLI